MRQVSADDLGHRCARLSLRQSEHNLPDAMGEPLGLIALAVRYGLRAGWFSGGQGLHRGVRGVPGDNLVPTVLEAESDALVRARAAAESRVHPRAGDEQASGSHQQPSHLPRFLIASHVTAGLSR